MSQEEEMLALVGIQLEGLDQAFEYLNGNTDRASLFQPGIPIHAYARQLRHLRAPQPGRPPPLSTWQTDPLRSNPAPSGAQKISEFLYA